MRAVSAPGLVVFTFVTTFAFIDWIMSLEPHWFSTMYGVDVPGRAGAGSVRVRDRAGDRAFAGGSVKDYVTKQHLHDLGNMMFAFMVLWAYLSFSQFLIIWAGICRTRFRGICAGCAGAGDGSRWPWWCFNFATPFVLLLMRGIKRNAQRIVQGVRAADRVPHGGRVLDRRAGILQPAARRFTGLDFVTPLAVGGLWLAGFFWQLKSRPLLPLSDPRLEGAPRETVAF